MSITLNIITKKLGFLSSVQRTICSRSQVILVHRGFLASQTLPSHIEKFAETRCSTSTDDATAFPNVTHQRYNHARKSFSATKELEYSLDLQANPCRGSPDDIIVAENYLSFNVTSQEDQSCRLNYSTPKQSNDKPSEKNVSGRPSDEQLIAVRESLARSLPQLFVKPLEYKYYHRDLVFINNLRGTESKGLMAYMRQIALLRVLGHIKFAYVKLEILKITSHPEDSTVRVRWRIRGIKGYMVAWQVLRYRKWRAKDLKQTQDSWYDGFSTFYVGADGLIQKHVADKVMPDDNPVATKTNAGPLAPKLAALCVGFALSAKDSIFPSSLTDPEDSSNL